MDSKFYPNIDDFLGQRDSRYFGNGYLKTDHHIQDLHLEKNLESLSFRCHGSVFLPEIWSQKGEKQQTPHLSTIDVIELAQECLRQIHAYTLHAPIIPSTAVKSIEITAGNTPVESDLEKLPITGQVISQEGKNYKIGLQIANMHLEILYTGNPAATPSSVMTAIKQPVEVSHVMARANDEHAFAFGVIKPLASHSHQGWSISSCFAASLQLGQTLLYQLDGIQRIHSNTLWMKRTLITLNQGLTQSTEDMQPIFVRLDKPKKYTKTDGEWRRADIFSLVCNANIVCSVTHRLPVSGTISA